MIIYCRHTNLETGKAFVTWHSLWLDDPAPFLAARRGQYARDEKVRVTLEEISEAEYRLAAGYKLEPEESARARRGKRR